MDVLLHGHDQFEKIEVKLQELSCFLASVTAGVGLDAGADAVLQGIARLPNKDVRLHELSVLFSWVAGLALAGCEELHGIAQFPKAELRPHGELPAEALFCGPLD